MSTPKVVERDERTVSVENASYRWAFLVFTYGLLLDVAYRGLVQHEAAWDLLALVVVGGGICTAYQGRQKTLAHGWVVKAGLGAVIAAVVAVVLAAVLTRTP
jgi:hypothetical protein